MDSITQAALGVVVADAVAGRQLGRRAALWGAALGTLPDCDVLLYPMLDAVERLYWHRGISHGLLLACVATPALAWLIRRWHPGRLSWRTALLLVGLVWSTHVFIDVLTVYGTGVWEPFSSIWVATASMFIIDPLYTLPLLVAGIAACAWSAGGRRWRWRLTIGALILSTAYIAWGFTAKALVERRFAQAIATLDDQHDATVQRWTTAPTVANTVLWRCLVAGERQTAAGPEAGFWIGYHSLLDEGDDPGWQWVPQRQDELGDLAGSRAVAAVRWFSQGWFVVRSDGDGRPMLSDLRFGEVTAGSVQIESVPRPWIFNFVIVADGATFHRPGPTYPPDRDPLAAIWQRLIGRPWPATP